jgi:glycosyltransferase involved in cell wall biosynthesis
MVTGKIAIITGRFPPQRSAVGDYALRLGEALAAGGAEVCVLASPVAREPVFPEGVTVIPVSTGWGVRGAWQVINILRRQRPQVVNLQYVPQMYNRYGIALPVALLPLAVRCLLRLPVVTTCHEFIGGAPRTLKAALLQICYAVQTLLILLGSRGVVVPAELHLENLQTYYRPLARKARLIPVGSNIPVQRRASVGESSAQSKIWTLATLGTGHAWWNYELALRTASRLRENGRKIHISCIGDIAGTNPVYFARLRALAGELGLDGCVAWTGYRAAEEVSAFLSAADVFFFTQVTGPTMRSTALMAALAHRLPVVATRGTDTDRYLLDSGAMIFVPADSPERAASEIDTLFRDAQLRREWARKALELYERKFSWSRIAAQYDEIFLDAAKHGGAVLQPSRIDSRKGAKEKRFFT